MACTLDNDKHGFCYNPEKPNYRRECDPACGLRRHPGLRMEEDYIERMRRDVREPVTAPKNNVQEGKPRMSLIPMDLLKQYLVPAYEEGIIKYERESWRVGFGTSVMVDAMLRHIEAFYWQGQDIDPDSPTGKHHLAGVIFCALSILHTLETRPELDDRPKKGE